LPVPLSAGGQPRFLARTTRIIGLSFLAASFLSLALEVPANLDTLAVTVPFFGAMVAGFTIIGRTRSLPWTGIVLVLGAATILLLGLDALGGGAGSTASAAILLGSGALPALVICNLDGPTRIVTLVLGAGLALVTTLVSTRDSLSPVVSALSVVIGWSALAGVAVWLSVSISRALARIARLGRAHLAERHATETEAQRRQGARLLHDTVLATLTLLAHSGVGVRPDALRAQASEDARLLRQLRLGGTPMPQSSGAYTLEATETSDLGHTLESVKQRFDRMGLTVSWHGAGRLLLPSDVLDAFLLSLAECLENVRRHSGVSDAEVTITQDDTTVRAMVTDTGVGFDLDQVDSARLGLAESVVARIRDVGGRTRLFSAPGSGTTVVLEVPKL
jgi:signal transduction histidine kinase